MGETIELEVNLGAYVRRETSRRWIATCPQIDVVTQGASGEEAKACLQEAVELWFESCIERGVLDQALREANFRPSLLAAASSDHVSPHRFRKSDILGEAFSIHLKIPGYRAETLLSTSA
jgi:predicted RNase H-like HicB family nuclease